MNDLEVTLSALSNATRREILWLTWDEERSAGEIAKAFDVAAPTVSQHLKILREADLVTMVVDGNFRRYRTRRDRLSIFEPYLRQGSTADWELPAALHPASASVQSETGHLARVRVAVALQAHDAFDFFVDARHFAHWVGENATSEKRDRGTFGFDAMGRTIRGIYWRFHPPSMLAMHWGFADEGDVPLPSDMVETTVYFSSGQGGTDIEILQAAANEEEAEFFAMAWSDRLGRLQDYIASQT